MILRIGKNQILRFLTFLVIVAFFAFNDYSYLVYAIKAASIILLFVICRYYKKNSYLLWIAAFITFSLLSIIWGIDKSKVIAYVIWTAQAMLIAYSIGLTIKDQKDVDYILYCIMIASFILGIRALYGIPFSQLGSFRIGKNIGYNENELALKAALGSISAFYFFLQTVGLRKKIVLAAMFIVPVVAVVFSGSRKGILMVGATILLFSLFRSKNPALLIRNIFFCLCGVYVFYLAINNIEILYNSFGRRLLLLLNLFNKNSYVGNSIGNRLNDIDMGMIAFKESPIIGYGLGNYEKATGLNGYAHNNYVQLLVDLGLVGFILYYWLYLKIGFGLLTTLKIRRSITSLCLSMLIVTILIEVGLVSYNSDYIQLVIMLCFYTVKLNRQKLMAESKYNPE